MTRPDAARLRITFHLTDAAAPWAGSALRDLFPDGLLLDERPGGLTRLRGWLKASSPRPTLDPKIFRRLALLGATRISSQAQTDTALSAPRHGLFPALRVGRFRIVPAASAPPPAQRRAGTLVLVQGQAFGSGRHESTRLMLRGIQAHAPRAAQVLDVGAGSGILGFACLELGALRVCAVEAESAACAELRRNRVLNAVAAARLPVLCGRFPLKRLARRRFSLVMANLVTPLLLDLMPDLAARVAARGALLCGGIHTEPELRAVLASAKAAGLAAVERARLRLWQCVRLTRP